MSSSLLFECCQISCSGEDSRSPTRSQALCAGRDLNKVVERADSFYGLSDVYEVREDGVKTYNGFVILASDKSVPYGTVVETSRGIGIVLDYHTVKDGKNLYDIATSWGKGGIK